MNTALIVGGGLIGMSFAARFEAHGWSVRIADVRPEVGKVVKEKLSASAEFFLDYQEAAKGVDFVQEAGPENLEWKHEVFARLGEITDDHTILASSSSAILPSKIAQDNPAAARIIIGHPFTPPALMPVLEVVPSDKTDPNVVSRAMEVYRSIGFDPSRLQKEIFGFVGNRIQKVIMWEAFYLLQQGVIDAENLDRIIRNSLGLRYAAVGPLEANRLGGGPEGARKIILGIAGGWDKAMPAGVPDMNHLDEVLDQIDAAYGTDAQSFEMRSKVRDAKLKGILEVLAKAQRDAGENS